MEYAKDLQSITPYSIRDQIGPIGNCPFGGMFHPTFASDGRKLSQSVDPGENGSREVVSGFSIFESDIVRFVFQIFECFQVTQPAFRLQRLARIAATWSSVANLLSSASFTAS